MRSICCLWKYSFGQHVHTPSTQTHAPEPHKACFRFTEILFQFLTFVLESILLFLVFFYILRRQASVRKSLKRKKKNMKATRTQILFTSFEGIYFCVSSRCCDSWLSNLLLLRWVDIGKYPSNENFCSRYFVISKLIFISFLCSRASSTASSSSLSSSILFCEYFSSSSYSFVSITVGYYTSVAQTEYERRNVVERREATRALTVPLQLAKMLAIRWRSIGRDAWIVFYALVVSEIMTSLLRFDAQRLAVANHCQTHVHSIAVFDMVELTSLIEISDKTFTYYIFNCTVHLHSLELYSFGFFFIFLSISFRHHRARRSTEKMKLASRRNDAMANDARPTNTAARTVFALTSMAVCTFIIMLRNFFLFFYFLLLPNISFASYEFILRIDFCFPSEFFRIIFFVCCVVCFGIVGLRYAKIWYSCRVDYYYFFS